MINPFYHYQSVTHTEVIVEEKIPKEIIKILINNNNSKIKLFNKIKEA